MSKLKKFFELFNRTRGVEDFTKAYFEETESIAGRKSAWDSKMEFIKWAKDHGYKTSKQDDSSNFWRLRQRDPGDFKELRTICINPGNKTNPGDKKCKVQAIGGPLKD